MKRSRDFSIDPSFYLALPFLTRFIEDKDHIKEEEICDIVLMCVFFVSYRIAAGFPNYKDDTAAFYAFKSYQVGLSRPSQMNGFDLTLEVFQRWQFSPAYFRWKDIREPIIKELCRKKTFMRVLEPYEDRAAGN